MKIYEIARRTNHTPLVIVLQKFQRRSTEWAMSETGNRVFFAHTILPNQKSCDLPRVVRNLEVVPQVGFRGMCEEEVDFPP